MRQPHLRRCLQLPAMDFSLTQPHTVDFGSHHKLSTALQTANQPALPPDSSFAFASSVFLPSWTSMSWPHRGQHSGFYRSCDCSLYFLDTSNSLLDLHGLGAASCPTHFITIVTFFSIPLARPTSCFRIFQNGLPSSNYCVCFKDYAVTLPATISVTSIN